VKNEKEPVSWTAERNTLQKRVQELEKGLRRLAKKDLPDWVIEIIEAALKGEKR
jgi:hypothetical protein